MNRQARARSCSANSKPQASEHCVLRRSALGRLIPQKGRDFRVAGNTGLQASGLWEAFSRDPRGWGRCDLRGSWRASHTDGKSQDHSQILRQQHLRTPCGDS